jgi:uncharacterized membrane-anchored protein YhcB (DUF1043 family)
MIGEETSWLWGTSLIALALGVVLGIGLALLFMQNFGRAKKLQQEVDRLEQELTEYRSQVTDHFKQTSTLVQKMTESYRDVYQHLANSSQQLCQEPMEMFQLGQQNKEPEKLIADKPAENPTEKSASFNTPLDDLLGGNSGNPQ